MWGYWPLRTWSYISTPFSEYDYFSENVLVDLGRCTPSRIAKKKLKVRWKTTYKISLLQLVETNKKKNSKEIMSNLHMKTK